MKGLLLLLASVVVLVSSNTVINCYMCTVGMESVIQMIESNPDAMVSLHTSLSSLPTQICF